MTTALSGADMARRLQHAHPDIVETWDDTSAWVRPEAVHQACRFFKETPGLSMDFLVGVTAVDYIEYFEMVYHLLSLENNHSAVLKTRLYDRDEPAVASIVDLWRGAELQEREVWDLMGVRFTGHPNLKRILTWEGFPGHPLRKSHLGG